MTVWSVEVGLLENLFLYIYIYIQIKCNRCPEGRLVCPVTQKHFYSVGTEQYFLSLACWEVFFFFNLPEHQHLS